MVDWNVEQRDNRLCFQLVTEQRWISGYVQTVHRRVIDLVNSGTLPAFVTRDASLASGPIHSAFDGTGEDQITVVTERVLFLVPVEPVGTTAPPADPRLWITKKVVESALLGIGPYEIFGQVHLPQGAELRRDFLSTGLEFFAVTDAVIRRLDGTMSLKERTVVVNRRRVDYAIPSVWPRHWAGFES